MWAEREQARNPYDYAASLCGLCAKASSYLHRLLTPTLFPAKLVINDKHCFVKVEKFVVDITATQFGIVDKVYIVEHKEVLTRSIGYYWKANHIFDTVEALVKHQKETQWPTHQIAVLE